MPGWLRVVAVRAEAPTSCLRLPLRRRWRCLRAWRGISPAVRAVAGRSFFLRRVPAVVGQVNLDGAFGLDRSAVEAGVFIPVDQQAVELGLTHDGRDAGGWLLGLDRQLLQLV